MSDVIPAQLLQRASRTFYGKYRGIVVDNEDPQALGRLRVQIPAVLSEQTTAWALPCLPFGGTPDSGLFVIPEVGAEVWVEFEQGDPNLPIWVGAFWSSAPDQAGEGDLGQWQTRTLRTVGGQVIRLDDQVGATSVTIRHNAGATIVIDDDGTITLTDAGGNVVTLDATGPAIRLEDANGNAVRAISSGITLDDGQGATVELNGTTVKVSATTVTVDAQVVQLGGGGEPVLKGSTFLGAYSSHSHPVPGVGASGPPIPTTEASALSTRVQTG